MSAPQLRPRTAGGGRVEPTARGWRLVLPPGPARPYRLAQLDDYAGLPRSRFPHTPGRRLRLRARVHNSHGAGTWGFGWWNHPFGLGLGFGGPRLFPTWPQSAWFFYAAAANFLSFHPHRAPAQGFFAGVTRAQPRGLSWPTVFLALSAGLLLWPRGAAWLWRRVAAWVQQEGRALAPLDPGQWHEYVLEWRPDQVRFAIDGHEVARTLAPRPPLGLVLWVDNQYAAWPPHQRPRWGLLPVPQEVVLELEEVTIEAAR